MSSLTITIIQTRLHWEDKIANLQMLEEKILGIKEKTEIVVLPEMFSTGFSMQPEKFAEKMEGETVQWMKRISIEKRIILTGSLIIKEENKEGKFSYYNRLIWMLPTGQYGYYNKRHLFGFAGEHNHYTAGNKRLIASVKGWRINLQVCYDLRFPVWARQHSTTNEETFTPEYDILINMANWPERRRHPWMTLLQARAIENQCYVIGVNRVGEDGKGIYHSGDSIMIDPLGEIIYTQKDEEDIFTYTFQKEELQKIRDSFPFLKDADRFTIG